MYLYEFFYFFLNLLLHHHLLSVSLNHRFYGVAYRIFVSKMWLTINFYEFDALFHCCHQHLSFAGFVHCIDYLKNHPMTAHCKKKRNKQTTMHTLLSLSSKFLFILILLIKWLFYECHNAVILTLLALVLIYPFPVDSVAVDFVAAVVAVRPIQCDTEQYGNSVANVTMLPFDSWPIPWYPTLCLPSAPSISNANQKMMFPPKCHPTNMRIILFYFFRVGFSLYIIFRYNASVFASSLTSRAVCRILHMLHCRAA